MESMDNWKQFQGTELGGLLSTIYGNENKPKINYPKFKTNQSSLPKKDFIPGGAKLEAVDPRKATRKPVRVAVPKVANGSSSDFQYNPIDYIPKRKNAEAIKSEIDEIYLRQQHFRPAHTKAISSDSEKERLNQIFSFKGGKGLPEELTNPVSETPLEVAAKRKEQERLNDLRAKKGLVKKSFSSNQKMSEDEQLEQQLVSEIEDRTNHLEEMLEIGISKDQERKLRNELAGKMTEYHRFSTKK